MDLPERQRPVGRPPCVFMLQGGQQTGGKIRCIYSSAPLGFPAVPSPHIGSINV
ncbi:hypothetical protein LX32DRAFT_638839 [Colletotrichum zoysiae]|uniref:Uncharacterized protein n=1 Tax=Colletotrichum zoysiae TaxID=1216348 RepID=A0AAD9HIE1_9PEZI|nr:hypothetical protein LX32DRAFT_638839 [Colletotrichum zoysiae]